MNDNALDNRQNAVNLREKILLEKQRLVGSMKYEQLTGNSNDSYGDLEHYEIKMQIISRLINALSNYIGTEEGGWYNDVK